MRNFLWLFLMVAVASFSQSVGEYTAPVVDYGTEMVVSASDWDRHDYSAMVGAVLAAGVGIRVLAGASRKAWSVAKMVGKLGGFELGKPDLALRLLNENAASLARDGSRTINLTGYAEPRLGKRIAKLAKKRGLKVLGVGETKVTLAV